MPITNVTLEGNYPTSCVDVSYGVASVYAQDNWLQTENSYKAWDRQPRPYITTLPYTVQKTSYVPSGFALWTETPAFGARSERSGFAGVKLSYLEGLASSLDDDVPLADAMNGALDSIHGSTWNFPVFAAEAHKTIDSVYLLAQKAAKGGEYLRKLKRHPKHLYKVMKDLFFVPSSNRQRDRALQRLELRAGTDDLAKAWLRYRYEVMTGLMDVRDAATTTADLLLAQPETHKSATRRTIVVELPPHTLAYGGWDAPFLLGPTMTDPHLFFKREAVAEITCEAWITTRRENPVLSEANQLGLVNWPANIWELLPGSFIADWVLDIGAYLERIPALCGLQVVDSGFSTYRRVGGVITAWCDTTYYSTGSITMEPVSFHASLYQRSPWPNPAPVWTPSIRLSTNRLIDAAALFRSIPLGRFKI